MNILFVSSGKKKKNSNEFIPSTITYNQASSLENKNIRVKFFLITNKGFAGYLGHIIKLRRELLMHKYDIIHAHYSLSGIIAALTFTKIPIITSLMGGDAYLGKFHTIIIKLMEKFRWVKIIAKSKNIVECTGIKNYEIIPNGVDINKFLPMEKSTARKKLNLTADKIYILFPADPKRKEKNFILAKKAFDQVDGFDKELIIADNIDSTEMVYYYNAVDLVLFTSLREGSPNVIKEAMACNCPIVSTDVGDVEWVIGETEGCYLVSSKNKDSRRDGEPKSIKSKDEMIKDTSKRIKEGLEFAELVGRTKGRERLLALGLDSDSVANKIIDLYKKVLK